MLLRHPLALSFLALLGGCAGPSCVAPNQISLKPQIACYYQFHILAVDQPNVLTVQVPDTLYSKKKYPEQLEPFERPREHKDPSVKEEKYKIRVQDISGIENQRKANPDPNLIFEFVQPVGLPIMYFVGPLYPVSEFRK